MAGSTIIAALFAASLAGGDVRADVAKKAADAEKSGTTVVAGTAGWLYFAPELRHLTVGTFWGPKAASVSKAAPSSADPLEAIVDFKRQCDKAGVDLILVPVPGKAAVYPQYLINRAVNLDTSDQEFFGVLRTQGIKVLDLTARFRGTKGVPTFCKQDTHWSGTGVSIAASAIAFELKKAGWYKGVPKTKYSVTPKTVNSVGDLGEFSTPKKGPESIKIFSVAGNTASSRTSPVVLLGDSHNLIFSAGGDMVTTGAGLPENLAAQLGFPVDVVAVRGSGATPARINLARRRDNLKGKKVVVWCFTTREFTEGQGWRKVPVVR